MTWLQRPGNLRIVMVALAILFAGYVGVKAYRFNRVLSWWSGMGPADTRQAVLYGVGTPREVRSGTGPWRPVSSADMTADAWAYQNVGGGRVEVTFSPTDGRVDRILCGDPAALPTSCEPLFGIALGTDELMMERKIGLPTRSELSGPNKIVYYDDVGATYVLRQYTVYQIAFTRHRTESWPFGRFVRSLVKRPW